MSVEINKIATNEPVKCCGQTPRRVEKSLKVEAPVDHPRTALWDPICIGLYVRCEICGRETADELWPKEEKYRATEYDSYGNYIAHADADSEEGARSELERIMASYNEAEEW